ncbi:MAG: hypothetical protein H6509_11630 [Bryobacterales bacterium]|nr:hypothetical protein [Bryobacterales bacterium]
MDLASPQANRFLAFYLLCLALLHAALYWVAAGGGPGAWALYYLEPRLGLYFLESLVKPGHPFPGYLIGASIVSIGLIGCLLLLDVVGLRFYLAFEILLALPTVILFAMIAISNAPPGLAFSPLDLMLPAVPFTLVSVLPVLYAWRVLRSLRAHGSELP